jgi:hypothetical protein
MSFFCIELENRVEHLQESLIQAEALIELLQQKLYAVENSKLLLQRALDEQ